MEGGKEQNYWPGFVDALSNVVLTLVFVLVIFVFALVMASSKVAERVEKRVRSEMSENRETEVPESKGAPISVESKALDQMRVGAVGLKGEDSGVILEYPQGVTEMDEKSAELLEKELRAKQQAAGKNHKVILKSFVGAETYSAARRFAYYRAINVRNRLIKLGEDPKNITMSIVTPPQPQDGRVEIVFKKD